MFWRAVPLGTAWESLYPGETALPPYRAANCYPFLLMERGAWLRAVGYRPSESLHRRIRAAKWLVRY